MNVTVSKLLSNDTIRVLLAVTLVSFSSSTIAAPWSFGIMADSQWKANLDGKNPDTVAVGIIKQINEQFIAKQVKFVIQVGDLVDKETSGDPPHRTMPTRNEAAQPLYDANICFFPLRGNHEMSAIAANEFVTIFPQTTGQGKTCDATNFISPDPYNNGNLSGLSYAFDYANVSMVLLDQFTRKDNTNYLHGKDPDNNVVDQVQWLDQILASKSAAQHKFVFGHKNLIGANHFDTIFGTTPVTNPDTQNLYFKTLQKHGVRYYFGGHDHNHMRSIVTSPDGKYFVQNIIASSNSYKFYTPKVPSIDMQQNLPAFVRLRESPIVQELYTIGYYIVTVDAQRVTIDYYAADNGCGGTLGAGMDCNLTTTPNLRFNKRETFGYSLNGKEFLIVQGGAYTVVKDSFNGTTMNILDGVNGSTKTLHDGRHTVKVVDTGWEHKNDNDLASNIFTLWGMTDLGNAKTDTVVLSMSYDNYPESLNAGQFGIVAMDKDGKWVNAVDLNAVGTKAFVPGPWKPGYTLGSYGIDTITKTAWAVINFDGKFAVKKWHTL